MLVWTLIFIVKKLMFYFLSDVGFWLRTSSKNIFVYLKPKV